MVLSFAYSFSAMLLVPGMHVSWRRRMVLARLMSVMHGLAVTAVYFSQLLRAAGLCASIAGVSLKVV